jgi:hypothetical protein
MKLTGIGGEDRNNWPVFESIVLFHQLFRYLFVATGKGV